ncbi:GFA family protein [Vibrio sp. 10N.247.310.17]|uniref:GFA family protein n=1 Tax=Vibrio sp. 10N.247.310.17 TaxID=3229979 RepID=UPI003551AB42
MENLTKYEGCCHCGAIAFDVYATKKLTVTLCNCDICYKHGHQELMIPEERFVLHKGQANLKPYRFGDCIADHTFCVVCGVMPFYRPKSHPEGYFSVNARCLNLKQSEHIEYVDFDGQNWVASIKAGMHKLTE